MNVQSQELNFMIQPANSRDITVLLEIDPISAVDSERQKFIEASLRKNSCYVIKLGRKVIGFGVLEYSFFGKGFVSMLYIDSEFRRKGAGVSLLTYLESITTSDKLFTSTNLSNIPMQTLLGKLGYILSGVVHNLDDNDPELIYFKIPNH